MQYNSLSNKFCALKNNLKFPSLVFVVLFLGLFFSFSGKASAATYYVDQTGGLDANTGLATDNAWKTIAKVNAASFSAGDFILFKKGETWREQLTVPSSGSAGSPITFGAYGSGNKPIIRGSESASSMVQWSRTNILLQSENIGTTWGNARSSEILDNTVAPNGQSTADKLISDSTADNSHYLQQQGLVFDNNTWYTYSIYAKYSDTPWIAIRLLGNGSSGGYYYANIQTGTSGATNEINGTITAVGNGWYRLTGTIFTGEGVTPPNSLVYIAQGNNDIYWGGAAPVGQGPYLWGAQVEATSLATSYMPTTTTPASVTIDNVWKKTGVTIRPNAVFINDVLGSIADNALDITNQGDWYWVDNTLFVYSTSDPSGTVEYGQRTKVIDVNGNDYITIDGLQISGSNYSYQLYNYGAIYAYDVNNLVVMNSNLSYNGYSGIRINNSHDTIIDNNDIGYNGGRGVDITTSTASTSYNHIVSNNSIYYNCTYGLNTGSDNGITLRHDNVVVYGNTSYNNAAGLYFHFVDNSSVHNNTLYNSTNWCGYGAGDAEEYGIGVASSNTTNFYSNTIHDGNNVAIQIYGDNSVVNYGNSNGNNVYNNYIYNFPYGLEFGGFANGTGMANNSIYNNIFDNNSWVNIDIGNIGSGNTIYNNILMNSGNYGFLVYNYPTSVTFKNNIIYNSAGVPFYADISSGINHSNNIYYKTSGTLARYGGTNYTSSDINTFEATTVISDPLFTIPGTDFHLLSSSPAINAGVNVGLTTDYAGNPIYGLPDMGAYEDQPPYTMGTDDVDTAADVRVYGDGKFQNTETAGGTTADLSVIPQGSQTTKWLDITKADDEASLIWQANHKKWKESSTTLGATNTLHTVGDLENNKYYNVKVDDALATANITGADCTDGVCKSNGSGKITFTYTGGYTSHTFDISSGDNTAPTVTNDTNPKFHTDTTSVTLALTTSENSACKYSIENTTYDNMTAFTTTGTTTHSTAVTGLTPGDYTYYAICRDGVGNDTSYTLTFEIAQRENDTGTTDAKLNDGDNQTLDEDKKIYFDEDEGRLKGQDNTIANGTVKIYKEGKKYATVDVDSDGSWSKKLKFGHDKTYTLKLKFYDEYGTLRDEKEYDVKVDTEKPIFTNPFSQVLTITKNDKINFEATDDTGVDYYKIQVLDSQGHIARAWRKQEKSFYLIPEGIVDQADSIMVRAYDKAGNYAEEEANLNIGENLSDTADTSSSAPTNNSDNESSSSQTGNTSTPNVCSYTVASGDTLRRIAQQVYGDTTAYPIIIEKNKDKYPDIKSKLLIGQELTFCDNNQTLQSTGNNSNTDNSLPTGQAVNQQSQAQNQTQPQPEPQSSPPAGGFRWWNPFTWF